MFVFVLRVIGIFVLAFLIMYFMRKFVESIFNLITLIKASKDPNHPCRAESSEVVFNRKTGKLENCGDVIKLPF